MINFIIASQWHNCHRRFILHTPKLQTRGRCFSAGEAKGLCKMTSFWRSSKIFGIMIICKFITNIWTIIAQCKWINANCCACKKKDILRKQSCCKGSTVGSRLQGLSLIGISESLSFITTEAQTTSRKGNDALSHQGHKKFLQRCSKMRPCPSFRSKFNIKCGLIIEETL